MLPFNSLVFFQDFDDVQNKNETGELRSIFNNFPVGNVAVNVVIF